MAVTIRRLKGVHPGRLHGGGGSMVVAPRADVILDFSLSLGLLACFPDLGCFGQGRKG